MEAEILSNVIAVASSSELQWGRFSVEAEIQRALFVIPRKINTSMGPLLSGSGNPSEAMKIGTKFERLQWGRFSVEAEIIHVVFQIYPYDILQGGRFSVEAEISCWSKP